MSNDFLFDYDNDEDYAKEHIRQVITSYILALDPSVDIESVTLKIYEAYKRKKHSNEDIFSGEYDKLIMDSLKLNGNGIKLKPEYEYIKKSLELYLRKNVKGISFRIVNEDIPNMALEILKKGKYDLNDPSIQKYLETRIRFLQNKSNSTEKFDENYLYEPQKRNTLMSNRTKTIIAAVVITGMVTAASAFIPENTNALQEPIPIEQIDSYSYPKIIASKSNEMNDTVENILNVYNMYISYGEEYGQIPLYRAYESITSIALEDRTSEKFYRMDCMLSIIGEDTKVYGGNEELHEDVSSQSCYVLYVYNKLVESGNKEILKPKYKKAVSEYNSQVANYKILQPYSLLSKESKSTLRKMMIIYNRYCNNLINDFEKTFTENINEQKSR